MLNSLHGIPSPMDLGLCGCIFDDPFQANYALEFVEPDRLYDLCIVFRLSYFL